MFKISYICVFHTEWSTVGLAYIAIKPVYRTDEMAPLTESTHEEGSNGEGKSPAGTAVKLR